MENTKYSIGDKVKFKNGSGREYVIQHIRENLYYSGVIMYGIGEEGTEFEEGVTHMYPEKFLENAEVTSSKPVKPVAIANDTTVWVHTGNGKGSHGVILSSDVYEFPNGWHVSYVIKFDGGRDYSGHTEMNVEGDNVYKYSPLERLARIERRLGIEDE